MKVFLMSFIFGLSVFGSQLPGDSLFHLEGRWTDNNKVESKFSNLQNEKYKVVTMIFTSCPSACPLMVSHVKKMDTALNEKQKARVEYLFFSIDPMDSAEQMKAFHQKFSLDERYRFLKSSNEDNIAELAAVLGFKYKKVDERMYSHGTDVYVLNPQGQVIGKTSQSHKAVDLVKWIPK